MLSVVPAPRYTAFHDLCAFSTNNAGLDHCITCGLQFKANFPAPEDCQYQAPSAQPKPFKAPPICDDRLGDVPVERQIVQMQALLHHLCDPTKWDQQAESTKTAIRKIKGNLSTYQLLFVGSNLKVVA